MEKKIKKEIRKEIREYILDDVNLMLSRLGVSEKVVETGEWEDKYRSQVDYQFCSAPIHQVPMMFKSLVVDGYMVCIEDEGEEDCVIVHIDYAWKHFDGGGNGCSIARARYAVKKELPKEIHTEYPFDSRNLFVRKIQGINL